MLPCLSVHIYLGISAEYAKYYMPSGDEKRCTHRAARTEAEKLNGSLIKWHIVRIFGLFCRQSFTEKVLIYGYGYLL